MKFFIFFIILILSVGTVFAVGIRFQNYDRTIVFEPNIEKSYSFTLVDSEKIAADISGDLTEYVKIVDPAPETGPRDITIDIKLPEYLEPGRYNIYVGSKEISPVTGAISALASVKVRIPVLVLYPGKLLSYTGMYSKDINLGEGTSISVNVHNYGQQKVLSASAKIVVYDERNNTITTLYTQDSSVESNGDAAFVAYFDSKALDLGNGIYHAVGKVYYDDTEINSTVETSFKIGSFKINVIDWKKEVIFNATNKFYVTVESDWAGIINDVHAKITTPNNMELKTPSLNLDSTRLRNTQKASGMLETYWETQGLKTGDYTLGVDIFYNEEKSSVHKDIIVSVVNGAKPIIEKPSEIQLFTIKGNKLVIFNNEMTLTLFLMIILSVIVAFNIVYFVLRKDNNKTLAPSTPPVQNNSNTARQYNAPNTQGIGSNQNNFNIPKNANNNQGNIANDRSQILRKPPSP